MQPPMGPDSTRAIDCLAERAVDSTPPFEPIMNSLPAKPCAFRSPSKRLMYEVTWGPMNALAATVEVRSYSYHSRDRSVLKVMKTSGRRDLSRLAAFSSCAGLA